ncbi:unnamed protein product [Brassicogethes aeneus]|uniref:Inositol polyphosphate-related phosphatase domain-containing protein n=1 Tax=Brassicogethes aeneus TaxID=1431903 RepID=A0A9P0BI22_BRAAE|nr:unnamed protein product [Brassicogethes aeneus]
MKLNIRMEHKQKGHKLKHKNTISSLLMPNKTPNKVGVVVNRSQSARSNSSRKLTPSENNVDIAISKRPLSFECGNHINHLSLKKDKHAHFDDSLNRKNSISDSNVYSDSTETTDLSENKMTERCASHESVLKDVPFALHLIPTEKARQRNFLQGKIGASSLLGAAELDRICPSRELTIFVGTWNMNGHAPPKELNDFVLPVGMEHVPDILTFGTQESTSEKFEWEVSLQETIGPSHLLFNSTSLGTLHLSIFIRRDLIWYVSIPEDASLSVRPGTAFRTKGAIASSFMLFGTSFLFVTAHLTAHQEKVKERVSDVKRIVNSLDLPKVLPCKNKNKDLKFWDHLEEKMNTTLNINMNKVFSNINTCFTKKTKLETFCKLFFTFLF